MQVPEKDRGTPRHSILSSKFLLSHSTAIIHSYDANTCHLQKSGEWMIVYQVSERVKGEWLSDRMSEWVSRGKYSIQ